jgi:hypothetical protein
MIDGVRPGRLGWPAAWAVPAAGVREQEWRRPFGAAASVSVPQRRVAREEYGDGGRMAAIRRPLVAFALAVTLGALLPAFLEPVDEAHLA